MANRRLSSSVTFISSEISCPGAITIWAVAKPMTTIDTLRAIFSGISAVTVPSSAMGNVFSKYSFDPKGRKLPTSRTIFISGL